MLTFVCLAIFGLILLIATGICLWQLLQQAVPGMRESAQEAQDVISQIRKYLEILFGKEFERKKPKQQPKNEGEEPIQDAEFKDVEQEAENATKVKESKAKETMETTSSKDEAPENNVQDKIQEPAKIPGSYERVELHLSSGVDYIEYYYFDDNDNPMEASKATKCLIRECATDGTVMRELWGKPYKNQIYDHMRDIFGRN